MNILKNLLFSFRGKIGRANTIYGIVYAMLIFLVSMDVLMEGSPGPLIGGGYDSWSLIQYAASILGVIISVWIYFAVIAKRLNALSLPLSTAIIYLCPLATLYLFQRDPETLARDRQHISLLDTIFFFAVIVIMFLATIFLYRMTQWDRLILLVSLAIATIINTLFWLDSRGMSQGERHKYRGIDTWLDFAFVLVIVFFLRSYVLNPFQIIGPSMEDSFHGGKITHTMQGQTYSDGEYILVDKMTYHFSTPKRGDVVVFTPNVGTEKRYLIKRVIGLPGDTVRIEDGFVSISRAVTPEVFVQIDESDYLGEKYGHTCLRYTTMCDDESATFHVPTGQYFLMGDNRPQSLDARRCFNSQGCTDEFASAQFVPLSAISGLVALSLGHFDLMGQILPYPTLGTFEQVIPFRWDMIQAAHDYPELP